MQTFPHVLDTIGDEHQGGEFVIIIDEAHSSHSGKNSSAVSQALTDSEDEINDALEARIKQKRLAKTVAGDPEYDVKKTSKKLRIYVESHSKAIRDQAEIMVDHFLEQVI